ncbi:MAG: AMP-binding protein [Gammaproteobacteria bacterium]|nr:AMP-binding protein [Gammaproteobacteria bacterium]MBU1645872.1 AMP-binding protein [Gammaproteobacteria bacterium]MBU1971934.1 AMP-binding protein [Gammaproteobacteria bacterium]
MSATLNIAGLVQHHARYRPGARAVVCGDTALDWREFDQQVNRLARALQDAGVAPGDRIATVLGNSLELLEIYWACARLGAVAVPLSPLLMESGLRSLLADAAPRFVFASAATAGPVGTACTALPDISGRVIVDGRSDGFVPWAEFVAVNTGPSLRAEVAPDDIYNIMYTSGTTGMPKGIVLTHRIRALYGTLLANAWRITADSVVLHGGAIVFNGSFVTLMPAFTMGATYVLHQAFDAAAFIETVAREKVTHTMLVPSQIVAILNSAAFAAEKLESLQVLVSLGAPLALAHKERLEALLPGRFHELYGLTEGFVTILDRRDAVRKQGSVGVPPPFFDLRILRDDGSEAAIDEVGEIVGRGPLLMPGYYKRPDLTAAAIRDGWLHTGDLGRIDGDGYLVLVDRIKDMIDSGGVKIYPRDVEEVIVRHPAVAEAVVFGIPDEKWGETPAAAVQLKVGAGATAQELREWINARVAARYQRLARVDIVAELPRNAAGKILKRELREPFWANRTTRI